MIKVLIILMFCGLFFGCTPSSNPLSNSLADTTDNQPVRPHPGDEVAAQYEKGISLFKPYAENPHPDLRLVDSAAIGKTTVFLRDSYQFTISWLQHGGPGYWPPMIRGARLSNRVYILSVQTQFDGGQPYWPKTNYYIVAEGRTELIETTSEPGFNSNRMYETSTCHIGDLRVFDGKFIFGGEEEQYKRIYSVFRYSDFADQLRFTNYCRSGGGPPPIVFNWEW